MIAASAAGYPAFGKHDASQFQYKDGVFTIPADGTLDLRAFLPRGVTIGKALAKAKAERGANLKHHQEDFMSFRIWFSHTTSGADATQGATWPTKLAEVPRWTPLLDKTYAITDESKSWPGAAVRWEDIRADMTSLRSAKSGHKLYVIFSVGYRYKTPGGQMESKWDDVRHKFVKVKSTGLVGFVHGAPLAACNIVIGSGPDQSSRLKVGSDGVTDTKTNLIWAKKAGVQKRYIDVNTEQGAESYVKTLGAGWRLPTVEELVALRKLGCEKPFAWFNAHGFNGVANGPYWTSTKSGARIRVVGLGDQQDPGVMDTTDKDGHVWAVKGK